MKFRCSCHKLKIELGRHNGTERKNRICKDCEMNKMGDEFHFIFECPKYSENRNRLLPFKYRSVKSMFSLCNLMNGNKRVLLNLAKFIQFGKIV